MHAYPIITNYSKRPIQIGTKIFRMAVFVNQLIAVGRWKGYVCWKGDTVNQGILCAPQNLKFP